VSLVASGTDADHGAARSAMSEKAMTSSSIDVALTVTEFGRKCRSNSGMCSSSHALAVHQSSDCARLTDFRQSTSCGSKQVTLRSGGESVTSQRHRSCCSVIHRG